MIEIVGQVIHTLYDVDGIISWGGILIICLIVFAETGLFAGFFLPGDSLLITAGIFAAAGYFNVVYLLVFVTLSAIIGDQVGYYIGHKTGKFIFSRKDSLFFKHEHLEKAKLFYDKHGPKTIVIARFVPIVRTFAPAVAGAVKMEYSKFVSYNIWGGFLWVFATILGGFFLGRAIPNIKEYLYLVIGAVILLSFLPIIIGLAKSRKNKHSINP